LLLRRETIVRRPNDTYTIRVPLVAQAIRARTTL
jgi:hypothetical protein